jgi:transcriptional regulator with XRE-family HTH domain
MREDSIISILRRLARRRGSQARLAAEIGCSPAYLSDVLLGNRHPGPKILAYFGLVKTMEYTKGEK